MDASACKQVYLSALFGVALFLGAAVLGTAVAQDDVRIADAVEVVSGDALVLDGQRVRLRGVDAPEVGQSCLRGGESYGCGQRAALALADKIGDSAVRCEELTVAADGVSEGVCYVRGEELNNWIVAHGWAVAMRTPGRGYEQQESEARRYRLGLWRGTFERPEDWRRRQEQTANRPPPGSDVMSGKISVAIGGTAGARYSADCTVETDDGDETMVLEGAAPNTHELDGLGLSCRFQTDQPLTIEVRTKGNISRTSTSGGTVVVNVR